MTETTFRPCAGTNRDGSTCRARAMPGRQHCHNHAPEMAGWRDERNRRGGRGKSNAARAAKRIPADIRDVLNDLYETMADLRAGTLPKGRATEIATIARAIVAAYEVGAVDSRVDRIESMLEEDLA